MRRILFVMAAAVLMAALVVGGVGSALAKENCRPDGDGLTCAGGSGSQGGGFGHRLFFDNNTGDFVEQGSAFSSFGGGGPGRCSGNLPSGDFDCVGKGINKGGQ